MRSLRKGKGIFKSKTPAQENNMRLIKNNLNMVGVVFPEQNLSLLMSRVRKKMN
jgi:hypothetical protein